MSDDNPLGFPFDQPAKPTPAAFLKGLYLAGQSAYWQRLERAGGDPEEAIALELAWLATAHALVVRAVLDARLGLVEPDLAVAEMLNLLPAEEVIGPGPDLESN